jgi:hypothetical protein
MITRSYTPPISSTFGILFACLGPKGDPILSLVFLHLCAFVSLAAPVLRADDTSPLERIQFHSPTKREKNIIPRAQEEVFPLKANERVSLAQSWLKAGNWKHAAAILEDEAIHQLGSNSKYRDSIFRRLLQTDEEFASFFSLSTTELIEKIDQAETKEEKARLSSLLAARWFGSRAIQTLSGEYMYFDEEQGAKAVQLLRAASDPKVGPAELKSLFARTWILNDFTKEDWNKFISRTLSVARDEKDKQISKALDAIRTEAPWKLVQASMRGFQGEMLGETHNGHFLVSDKALTSKPDLLEKILSKPGTQITVVGRSDEEKLKDFKKRFGQTAPGRVHNTASDRNFSLWTTDYQGIAVKQKGDTSASPTILDAHYGGGHHEDKLPQTQSDKRREFPLKVEGGNLMRLPSGVNVASRKFLEDNMARYDFPEAELKALIEQTLGKTVFVPYTDHDTGHVDMDVTLITSHSGPVALIPQVDLKRDPPIAAVRLLQSARTQIAWGLDGTSSYPSALDLGREAMSNANGLADKAKKLDEIAKQLAPHIKVVRTPSLVGRSWFNVAGTASMANSVFFRDSSGKTHLIVPEYKDAPDFQRKKAEFVKTVSPLVDTVEFLDTQLADSEGNLAALGGVFHCIAPQCQVLPRPGK